MIACFNSADVFEDFYPSYGVDQRQLLTGRAREGGNSQFISMLQRESGDVIYYHFSLAPEFREALGGDVIRTSVRRGAGPRPGAAAGVGGPDLAVAGGRKPQPPSRT